ncbi:hypothetical protein DPEC_G00009410 [Dallia pectoralis]|uniref:Uncharacterized protein n=1 Tax=Dallia pectoralis TaxID=75939 RepID=A0ACC2HKT5_DALPE|nr:hypothetical protein DPEC_G00009410 [Dallia pectoralis]
MSEMKCSRFTDIEELATSSLLGLLVTIKEHITKPTAMAQGRVAHLIEWKDWGTGGEGVGRGRDWRNLQEDEKMYSHLSDEIKEARFAAGVAEQFALAEAAMNIWPKYEDPEQPSTGIDLLQDSHVLCDFMLDGDSDQQHSENGRNIEVSSMFWHVDSSSLSEDEVFYDYGKDKRPRRDIW